MPRSHAILAIYKNIRLIIHAFTFVYKNKSAPNISSLPTIQESMSLKRQTRNAQLSPRKSFIRSPVECACVQYTPPVAYLADGTHGIELYGDELSKSRRVVISHSLRITEGLQDRICLRRTTKARAQIVQASCYKPLISLSSRGHPPAASCRRKLTDPRTYAKSERTIDREIQHHIHIPKAEDSAEAGSSEGACTRHRLRNNSFKCFTNHYS